MSTYHRFLSILGYLGREWHERIINQAIAEIDRNNGRIPYEHGYVYAIHAIGTNYFKFGKSVDPDRRLLQISPKLMFDTEFAHVWPTQFMSHAERYLHEYFSEYRRNGEWFELSEEWQVCLFFEMDLEFSGWLDRAYYREFWLRVTGGWRDFEWLSKVMSGEWFHGSGCDDFEHPVEAAHPTLPVIYQHYEAFGVDLSLYDMGCSEDSIAVINGLYHSYGAKCRASSSGGYRKHLLEAHRRVRPGELNERLRRSKFKDVIENNAPGTAKGA